MVGIGRYAANTVLFYRNSLTSNLNNTASIHDTAILPLVMMMISPISIKVKELNQGTAIVLDQQLDEAEGGCSVRNGSAVHGDF